MVLSLNEVTRVLTNNRNINKFPSQERPIFVIKWGPPASGKSSRKVRETIKSLGYPSESYIHLNIDDIVESVGAFRELSSTTMNNFGGKNMTLNQVVNFLDKANELNVQKLYKIYTNIRLSRNTNGITIENKMDNILEQSLLKRINITFETTGSGKYDILGSGWPSWLWQKYPLLLKNYKIIIIFPLVKFETTWKRYKYRAARMYKNGSGIRFGTTKNQLKKIYVASYRNFEHAFTKRIPTCVSKVIILEEETEKPFVHNLNNNKVNKNKAKEMSLKVSNYINEAITNK